MPIVNIQAAQTQRKLLGQSRSSEARTRIKLEVQTLREARSKGRAKSKNPNTRLEVRAEDLIDKILTSCSGSCHRRHCNHQQHHAEAQRAVIVAATGSRNNNPIRPDIVIRDARTGRAVAVIDAKNYIGGAPLPLCQVEKLVRDMRAVGAPLGGLFVAKSTRIGPKTSEYAALNNVKIVTDGKNALRDMEEAIQVYGCDKSSLSSKIKEMLRSALDKVSMKASASRPAPPPSPLRLMKDGTPDLRFSANRTALVSKSPANARGPLKKDGTPDMRYKANTTTTRSYATTVRVSEMHHRPVFGDDIGN
ncbi:hypothetical protein HDU90_004079 [Geranomyces variabilis]|nr:hypothetical protein HDU90_004079 [Geranomyces variabilis]